MSYSDWQADTIRRALNRFRYNAGKNGSALSMTKVHEQIRNADRTSKLEYEVLRRFATTAHVPEAQNLDTIRSFLVTKNYLADDELDLKAAELEEMLAIQTHLANYGAEAKEIVSEIRSDYQSTMPGSFYTDAISFRTMIDRSGHFFKAEEFFTRTLNDDIRPRSLADRQANWTVIGARRKGYGFVSTSHNLVYVFLRGADPMDRVTYVQTWPSFGAASPLNIVVMRSGFETIANIRYADEDGPVELANIYRLVPVEDAGVRT